MKYSINCSKFPVPILLDQVHQWINMVFNVLSSRMECEGKEFGHHPLIVIDYILVQGY